MPYLFGDNKWAALRLRVLASAFAPSSRAFLQDVVKTPPQLALDLGCGPGYTTLYLLARIAQSVRSIGLDSSEHFLSLAARYISQRVSFERHDVTQIPFPTGPGDLIYCRLLLTHLQNPQAVIARWATQLRPGGLLLLEEVEWIQTNQPLFRTYLDIVAALLEQQRNTFYIGPLLDSMSGGSELTRRLSRVYRVPVPTALAATMFTLNIRTWKNQPFIQQHYGASVIEPLEEGLRTLTQPANSEAEIEWGMRQIAYEHL
jgi:trans-aconitate 2-methyltransferase